MAPVNSNLFKAQHAIKKKLVAVTIPVEAAAVPEPAAAPTAAPAPVVAQPAMPAVAPATPQALFNPMMGMMNPMMGMMNPMMTMNLMMGMMNPMMGMMNPMMGMNPMIGMNPMMGVNPLMGIPAQNATWDAPVVKRNTPRVVTAPAPPSDHWDEPPSSPVSTDGDITAWCAKHKLEESILAGLELLGFRVGDNLDGVTEKEYVEAGIKKLQWNRVMKAYRFERLSRAQAKLD
jgi:hypothetical protein